MSYASTISAAAAKYGVPPQVLSWQINQESGGNPNAVNPASGATGIAQFLPSTAAQFGIDPLDPTASINAAAQYDAQLYSQTGSWTGALTSYGTLANVPPSVWQSWQPVAQSVGESGTAGAGGAAGAQWPWWMGGAGPGTAYPSMGGAGPTTASPLGGLIGGTISRWQEIAVRVAVGALGVVLLGAGFFLAGRRVPGAVHQAAAALPGARHL